MLAQINTKVQKYFFGPKKARKTIEDLSLSIENEDGLSREKIHNLKECRKSYGNKGRK